MISSPALSSGFVSECESPQAPPKKKSVFMRKSNENMKSFLHENKVAFVELKPIDD
jgi:hypothetical protein